MMKMKRTRTCCQIVIALVAIGAVAHAQPARRGTGGGAGQPQGSITGKIIDSAAGTPLNHASISIRSATDSTLATGAIADREGAFTISGVRPGRYFARVTFVGFLTRTINGITVAPGAETIDLGTISLAPNAALGNEVTVNAQREFMTMGIDRTIYKTSDLKVTAGGSATDILRNIPSVDIDANDNVSLKGSQNVVIQINGRSTMVSGDQLATFLRGLPADAIDRVEVIPNPSAKYDPDGMSGIINIVFKQNSERGFGGGVSGSVGTRDNYSISGNLNYGSGPWSVFGSYGFNYGNRGSDGSYTRQGFSPILVPYLAQTSSDANRSPSHVGNVSVDYNLTPQQTLSFSAMVNGRNGTQHGTNRYTESDSAQTVMRRYERGSSGENSSLETDLRLGHKWVLEAARHELATELRFTTDADDRDNSYVDSDLTLDGSATSGTPAQQHTQQNDRNRNLSVQVDYTRPFGDASRMEAGFKGSLERLSSEYFSENFSDSLGGFVRDTRLDNDFTYDRNIHAVYATFGQDFGKVTAQAGLRAEQALTTFHLATTGASFSNDYFSLFPSAFVIYKPVDEFQWKASFSRRINRPRTGALNPITSSDDPHFRRSGNPDLRPEYTNAYEMSGTAFIDRTSLTLTGFYRRTTDVMRRFATTDSSGITTMSWTNFDVNSSYGADLTATLRLGDWFSGFLFLSGYQSVTDASNVDTTFNADSFQWMLRANGTFTLMEGLDLQATFMYRPRSVVEGATMDVMSNFDLALQKHLFDDQGRIGLRISDPFDTQHFSIERTDLISMSTYYRKPYSRILSLTFSYSFGAADKRRQRQQQPSTPNTMNDEF